MEFDREQVSRLVDGRLAGADFDATLRGMDDADAYESWRVYHLIGDVMRAPELAAFDADADFVARLRTHLTPDERLTPVAGTVELGAEVDVARPAANDHVFRWKAVAGLASFAAVATIGWSVLGGAGPRAGSGLEIAMNTPAGLAAPALPQAPAGTEQRTASPAVPPGAVWRDPGLDRFLAAHRQVAGGAAFDDASGYLHNAAFESPAPAR